MSDNVVIEVKLMFHILVVDDDKNTRMYFQAVLERDGYTSSVARNGEEALEILSKEHIDLVVLDIMMPKMDGYEFTKILREADNNLPILMVSAKQLRRLYDKARRSRGVFIPHKSPSQTRANCKRAKNSYRRRCNRLRFSYRKEGRRDRMGFRPH